MPTSCLYFTGSYGRVAAFARGWRADRHREQQTTGRGTFVPLVFQPGEAFQFDWSEDFAVLGGERTKLQVAHIKLSHSRRDPRASQRPAQHDPIGVVDLSSGQRLPRLLQFIPR